MALRMLPALAPLHSDRPTHPGKGGRSGKAVSSGGVGSSQPAMPVELDFIESKRPTLEVGKSTNFYRACSERAAALILPSRKLVEVADRAGVFWSQPDSSFVAFAAHATGHFDWPSPHPPCFFQLGKRGGELVKRRWYAEPRSGCTHLIFPAEQLQLLPIGWITPKEDIPPIASWVSLSCNQAC